MHNYAHNDEILSFNAGSTVQCRGDWRVVQHRCGRSEKHKEPVAVGHALQCLSNLTEGVLKDRSYLRKNLKTREAL